MSNKTDRALIGRILGYSLRTGCDVQTGAGTDAPAVVWAGTDYEVGDGTCGLHEDQKQANELAIPYVRFDALTAALDRADASEARSTKLLEQYYAVLAEQGRCAWNDAIEAAAECVDGNHPIGIIEEILALKKGAKT